MRMKTKLLAALGFCLFAVNAMAQNVPIFKDQGGAKMTWATGSELEMQSGSTLDIQSGVTMTVAGAVSFTSDTTFGGTLSATTLNVSGLATLSSNTTVAGTLGVTGTLTPAGAVIRTGQEYIMSAGGKPGASNGWLTTGGLTNLAQYTLPASEATTATMVIPVGGLKVGWTITGWSLRGQIESAGGTVELDGDLRKLTVAAGALADASVGTITGINVSADTAIASTKTGLTEVIAATETFYVLLQGTTAGSTDIAIQSITITVTEN